MKQQPGKYSVLVINRGAPDKRDRIYDSFRFYDNNPRQVEALSYFLTNLEAIEIRVKVFRGVNRATKERVFKKVKQANLEGHWPCEPLDVLFD